ncbi:serine hydrolase [Halostagnicola sp. A-GB9-2]|uniref:serine hydrolase domain-containing protein n=1 Tax=Halostagnicola sp. A-GB9-2 TaxID=3048066 RepID=UPI0024C00C44|nr:serine hydrolase [Halostagnicola sp. A-GB9-2]MDJ1434276.1 serine hydrolase [Halostagnicola sp. A-GB9-2]
MAEYYPPQQKWERREPIEEDMDPELIHDAVDFAKNNETDSLNRDFSDYGKQREDEGDYKAMSGPLPRERGGPSGVIIRNGHIVAEWGDLERVDLTFSVTKSFLSTVGGVAYDQDLLGSVDDKVKEYVRDGGFDYSHNHEIEWENLFQQTSEWEGALFGRPDRVDRREGRDRELQSPGTFWEYNDVRVNRLSLSLLRLLQKPLPLVLKEEIMDPIGASNSWQWHGYDNSDVLIDSLTSNQKVKSVSGGGHWGGGLWINTLDLARVGQLYLTRGIWRNKQLISEEWIDKAISPCDIKPEYGYLWWLNTDQLLWPDVPETSFAALGFGKNVIWVDPEHNIVTVLRWFDDASTSSKSDSMVLPNMNKLFRKITSSCN